MQTEQPLPIKVRIWLNHKVILSHKTNHYKDKEVAESLSKCLVILRAVRKNCIGYNKEAICRMLLAHENHLRKILPHPNNASYAKALLILEEMISTAKNHLQCKS
ncbi:MAG: hypothetical protein V4608_03220 [Bacteroidota bacterium]